MDFNSLAYDQKFFNFTAAQLSAERECYILISLDQRPLSINSF